MRANIALKDRRIWKPCGYVDVDHVDAEGVGSDGLEEGV